MPNRAHRLRVWLGVCVCVGLAGTASGQAVETTEGGLTPRQVILRLTDAAGDGTGIANIGEVIADLVGLEVSTAPIGSSAGGFTFTFDPVTRSFVRAAPSFGPMFGERAITAGAGRANFGVNYIHTTYDTLEGVNIREDGLQTVALRSGGSALFTGVALLNIKTDALVLFSSVALNRWFDAGVSVPLVTLRVDGTHRIADRTVSGGASARGVGDIALRGKIRLYEEEQGGAAVGVDLRLPTGDAQSLLGAGVTRTLVTGIWSKAFGPISPHASGGYEFWSDPFQVYDPLQQSTVDAGQHGFAYDAGVEWVGTERLTVNGEFIGRTISDGGRLTYRDVPLLPNPFGITSASVASVDSRGLNRLSASAGIKWNFAGTALLTANVLLPINDAGLRDTITPIIGLDWGF